jgi:hypothetical protein
VAIAPAARPVIALDAIALRSCWDDRNHFAVIKNAAKLPKQISVMAREVSVNMETTNARPLAIEAAPRINCGFRFFVLPIN